MATITFKRSKLFNKTFEKTEQQVKKKFADFVDWKSKNPTQPFGGSDYAFSSKSVLGGYWHAHLTRDMSLIYRFENGVFYLYGIFSHRDLGTGTPPNPQKQKQAVQKLDNQVFERVTSETNKMKSKKLLVESLSTNVLAVDIQPSYEKFFDAKYLSAVIEFLNSRKGDIYFLYNGDGYTDDDEASVVNFLIENGLNEDVLAEMQFIEKYYGFLRDWMDSGVPDRLIIKVLREMAIKRLHTSLDLDLKDVLTDVELEELTSHVDFQSTPINMPDFIALSLLKKMSPFYMLGGAKNECLREIELICNAFNIKFKRVDNLVY